MAKIVDAKDVVAPKRKSPVSVLIDSLPDRDKYHTVNDAAEYFNVHPETIRRLIKARDINGDPKVNAPSKALQQGSMVVYLFTEEDMKELENYFGAKTGIVDKES